VISQTNVVSVVAVAANQGSTSQNPAPAGVSAPGAADSPQSSSDASSVPSTDGQPVQSGQPAQSAGAKQQPQQPADAVQQHRQPVRAVSILAFAASSSASLPTPEHKATSSTTSASRPRAEGAAGRSGVFGPNTAANEGSDRAAVDSDGSSIQAARPQAERTGAEDSRGAALGSVRDRVSGWLGRTATAARPKLPADSARGMSLGVLTLTALLVGLLGWALLSWPPFPRR
jgi:hypothetical protein